MKSLVDELNRIYPNCNFQIVEDENDPTSCIIYTDNSDVAEDEADVLDITDLVLDNTGYIDAKVVFSLDEDLYVD